MRILVVDDERTLVKGIKFNLENEGYQVDCGEGWFGKIYDEFRRNKVIWAPTPEQQAALDKAVDVFGWNEYRIRAEGPRIQTWINGVLCIDYTEADPNVALDGLLGPQVHSGGACLVQVKDVTIEERWIEVVAEVVGRYGRLDILVSNAGIGIGVPSIT